MSEQAIFTNLCCISDGQGNLLLENRLDPDWPGWCFPGGHVEPGESFVASVIREVWEETGLTVENPILRGVKQFPTADGARYVVFLFSADRYHGTLHGSDEGEVRWLPRAQLDDYVLADNLKEMLQVIESDTLSEFQYVRNGDGWALQLH